jgi:Mce-associated membrane protein
MFNEAADVLLDPGRRRDYDASLSARSGTPVDLTKPLDPRVEADPPAPDQPPPPPATVDLSADVPAQEPPEASEEGEGPDASPGRFVSVLGSLSLLPLALLAVVTVLVVAGGVVAGVKVHQAAQVLDARTQAPPAAERAAKALFSYDYRTLPADRRRARQYLAGSFAQKYLTNFDALEKQKDGSPGLAVQTKAVVTASAQGSGVVDAQADSVRVLVFLNVVSHKGTTAPQVFQNRVAMTMRRHGDRWLVSNVTSY